MKKVKEIIFFFLAAFCILGIFKVAAISHLFFTVKFLDSFIPSVRMCLVGTFIMISFPVVKEIFRRVVGRLIYGLKSSWSFSFKGIFPGLRVEYRNFDSILSKSDLLALPIVGLLYDVTVILAIYYSFYWDYANKESYVGMRELPHFFYLVLIFAYLDLIINLSPIAKYDFYKILAIGLFNRDPRTFSYGVVRRFFNGSKKNILDLKICLAFFYLVLTFGYLCFVVIGFYNFFFHIYVLNEHTKFGILVFLPLVFFITYLFLRIFILPCLPHRARMRIGFPSFACLKNQREYSVDQYSEEVHSLNLNFPHYFYHLPIKKFIPDEFFVPNVKIRKYNKLSLKQNDWRALNEDELKEIYKINPISYWNFGNGRLVKRLKQLLSLTATLKEIYPLESYQYLYDVALLTGQKYHFSRNQDLVQRTTFSSFAENLSSYFQKTYRQARFVKTILPITIKSRFTNKIELIVLFNDVDFCLASKLVVREVHYQRAWERLNDKNILNEKKYFPKLRNLPNDFLKFSKVLPFKKKTKLEKYFFNLPSEEITFWKKENLISEFDGSFHLNLPKRGYIIPLQYAEHIFGFKVRSLTSNSLTIRSLHPFLEFFESNKFMVEKYSDVQDDAPNFLLPNEKNFPCIHYLPGKIGDSDLYVFEGELNANAFAYMFNRSVIATGGLCFLQIHDIIEELKNSFRNKGYRRIILCFDLDQKSSYFFSRIDGLKDAHFRALQMAAKLTDDFEVLFLAENSKDRKDNDELLEISKQEDYGKIFFETYGATLSFSDELSRIFGNKCEMVLNYLNLNYQFSFIYHQIIVKGLSSKTESDLLTELHTVDHELREAKIGLFKE